MIATKSPLNTTEKVIALPLRKTKEKAMIKLAGKHLTFSIDLQKLINLAEPIDLSQYDAGNFLVETDDDDGNFLLFYVNLTPK